MQLRRPTTASSAHHLAKTQVDTNLHPLKPPPPRAGHLAGIPLPEVDAELLPLQQEVSGPRRRVDWLFVSIQRRRVLLQSAAEEYGSSKNDCLNSPPA